MAHPHPIRASIVLCDRLYNRSGSIRIKKHACKTAILELCGWVETEADLILSNHAARRLSEPAERNGFEEKLRRNSGFEYRKHIKSLLVDIEGRVGFLEIEAAMDQVKRQGLEGALSSLKPLRNDAAHTHLQAAQEQYWAPSITIRTFDTIEAGLRELNARLAERL